MNSSRGSVSEWQLDAWKHALLEPFPKRGRLFYTANFRQIIRQIITEQNPDILFVHQAYLMPLLPETSVPIVLDMMDILSEHERQIMDSTIKITHRIQGWLEWKKMQAVVRSAVRRAAFCTVVSKDDQQKLLELIPHKVAGAADRTAVVPNGVDTDYFQPSGSDDVEKGVSILFTGSMNYDPNSDAARWFYSQIFPFIRARCPDRS